MLCTMICITDHQLISCDLTLTYHTNRYLNRKFIEILNYLITQISLRTYALNWEGLYSANDINSKIQILGELFD